MFLSPWVVFLSMCFLSRAIEQVFRQITTMTILQACLIMLKGASAQDSVNCSMDAILVLSREKICSKGFHLKLKDITESDVEPSFSCLPEHNCHMKCVSFHVWTSIIESFLSCRVKI